MYGWTHRTHRPILDIYFVRLVVRTHKNVNTLIVT
jgi:hypothetical protein